MLVVRGFQVHVTCCQPGRIRDWQEHVALDAADRGRVPEREGLNGAVHAFEQGNGNVLLRHGPSPPAGKVALDLDLGEELHDERLQRLEGVLQVRERRERGQVVSL